MKGVYHRTDPTSAMATSTTGGYCSLDIQLLTDGFDDEHGQDFEPSITYHEFVEISNFICLLDLIFFPAVSLSKIFRPASRFGSFVQMG